MSIWNNDFYHEDDAEEEEYDIDDYYWFVNSFFTSHDILESYYSWQTEKLRQSESSSIDYFSISREFQDIFRRRDIIESIFKGYYYYQELNPRKSSKSRRRGVFGTKKYKRNRRKGVKKSRYNINHQQTTIAKKIRHSSSHLPKQMNCLS
jgi:hypothetical protein